MTATTYFFGLVIFTILLFLLAYFLPKSKKPATLDELYALSLSILGDGFYLTKSNHFITITKNNQKIALLTLDKTLKTSSRKLGDSIVINFKTLPSKKALHKMLLEQKVLLPN